MSSNPGVDPEDYLEEVRRIEEEYGRATVKKMDKHARFSQQPAHTLFGGITEARIEAGLVDSQPEECILGVLREEVESGQTEFVRSRDIAEPLEFHQNTIAPLLGEMARGEIDSGEFNIEHWATHSGTWRVERG